MPEQDVTNAIILEKLNQMDSRLGEIRSEQSAIKDEVTVVQQCHAVHLAEAEAIKANVAENSVRLDQLNSRVWGIAGFEGLLSAVAVFLGLK